MNSSLSRQVNLNGRGVTSGRWCRWGGGLRGDCETAGTASRISFEYSLSDMHTHTYMKSQGQNATGTASISQKEKEFFVECGRCRRVCYSDTVGEVTVDDESDLAIVRVGEEALCGPCLQLQIQEQMQETRVLQDRFIYFKEFQSSFEEAALGGGRETQLSTLQAQVSALQVQAGKAESSAAALRQASARLKQQFHQLQAEEEKFWQGINKIERRTAKVEEKALNTKFDRLLSKAALDELSRMSVLHLFLDIKVEDNVGFVQGMAMGRRAEGADVIWEEVAVGLGHLLVGLHFLASKYTYQYHRIDSIVLRGAQSEVLLRGRKKPNTMHWKDGEKLFGQLLEALLAETALLCQHMLEAESMEYSQQFRMPFLINPVDNKIVDLWIDPLKLQERTRWGSWSKAMRYFLIDFKHIATLFAINDKHL